MLFQRKDSEIAPRRARSKEFLIKKYSELCELCTTMLESLRGLRKFSGDLEYSNTGN